jgi:hypothetical protein
MGAGVEVQTMGGLGEERVRGREGAVVSDTESCFVCTARAQMGGGEG